MMECFQSTLPPDVAGLGALRRSLTSWLKRAGVADPPRGDVVLATHEAVANAIEHAGSTSPVDIRAQLEDGTITIEVTDRGRWAGGSDGGEDRGRGLTLIAALVSELEIHVGKGGTMLRLVHHA